MEHGDDQAALLNPGKKPLTQIVQDDSFREFEFRQYLFACQAKVIFMLCCMYKHVTGLLLVYDFTKRKTFAAIVQAKSSI